MQLTPDEAQANFSEIMKGTPSIAERNSSNKYYINVYFTGAAKKKKKKTFIHKFTKKHRGPLF